MNFVKTVLTIAVLIAGCFGSTAAGRSPIVADAQTRQPLANASVFDHRGHFLGICGSNGAITCASPADYPLTIRYIGYREQSVDNPDKEIVLMNEQVTELHEIVVEAKQKRVLHILGYVREYSTLSSYTDTVTMFREKMVDFMLPVEGKMHFKGWRLPRVLNSKSYYRFTNAAGLDSVSDRCNHHFTWSDRLAMFPNTRVPGILDDVDSGTDSLKGRYGPVEIWNKHDGRVSVAVDVLADSVSRRWVPNMSTFFKKDDMDFEQFRLRINYDGSVDGYVSPLELTGYSANLNSRGRGHGMFMFNRHDQPFFVTTYTEVYIVDREFISVKEAMKWESLKFGHEWLDILVPPEAPELHPSIIALMDRVANIDTDQVRVDLQPDRTHISPNFGKKIPGGIGHRALWLLKNLTGISSIRAKRNMKRQWNDFRKKQSKSNNQQSADGPN